MGGEGTKRPGFSERSPSWTEIGNHQELLTVVSTERGDRLGPVKAAYVDIFNSWQRPCLSRELQNSWAFTPEEIYFASCAVHFRNQPK